jgi:hypothetical protein
VAHPACVGVPPVVTPAGRAGKRRRPRAPTTW